MSSCSIVSIPGGGERAKAIAEEFAGNRVMMLTVSIDKTDVLEALRLGARRMSSRVSGHELVQALRAVINGERYFSAALGSNISDRRRQERGGKGRLVQGAEPLAKPRPLAGGPGHEQQKKWARASASATDRQAYLMTCSRSRRFAADGTVLLMKNIVRPAPGAAASICPATTRRPTIGLLTRRPEVLDLGLNRSDLILKIAGPSTVATCLAVNRRKIAVSNSDQIIRGTSSMVSYIKSDLEFTLEQIKIRRGTCCRSARCSAGRPRGCLRPSPWACVPSTAPTTTAVQPGEVGRR